MPELWNNNCISSFSRDALIVSGTNSFTSILAGLVIFSALGYMAQMYQLPIDSLATAGEHSKYNNSKYCSLLCISWLLELKDLLRFHGSR